MPDAIAPESYRALIRAALDEDLGAGDLTSVAIIPADMWASGVFVAKSPVVVCGLEITRDVFRLLDSEVEWHADCSDGEAVGVGDVIGRVRGRARALLAAERTALNILQHLSGIATVTRSFVEVAGPMTVLDTRKTLPGMRQLAKYAVRCGGGRNHRNGLFDAVLIKDNHIRVAGGIGEAVRRMRAARPELPIEVEAQSLDQVSEAMASGADTIMLDNFDDRTTATAIAMIGGRARVELSGNMTLERVRQLAGSGADMVSVGALTHSVAAADISLEIDL